MRKQTVSLGTCLANATVWLVIATISSNWLIQVADALVNQPEVSIFLISMMRIFISVLIVFVLLALKSGLRKENIPDNKIGTLMIGLAMLVIFFLT